MAWAIQTVYELLEEVGADINFDPAAPMKTPEDVSKRWKDLEKQRKCFAALLSILRDPRESPRPPMRTPDEHRVVCLLCLIRTVALRLAATVLGRHPTPREIVEQNGSRDIARPPTRGEVVHAHGGVEFDLADDVVFQAPAVW